MAAYRHKKEFAAINYTDQEIGQYQCSININGGQEKCAHFSDDPVAKGKVLRNCLSWFCLQRRCCRFRFSIFCEKTFSLYLSKPGEFVDRIRCEICRSILLDLYSVLPDCKTYGPESKETI